MTFGMLSRCSISQTHIATITPNNGPYRGLAIVSKPQWRPRRSSYAVRELVHIAGLSVSGGKSRMRKPQWPPQRPPAHSKEVDELRLPDSVDGLAVLAVLNRMAANVLTAPSLASRPKRPGAKRKKRAKGQKS